MLNLSIYVLTYNAPDQFQLWCEAFNAACLNCIDKVNKFVINNSDDPIAREKYDSLITEFGFQPIDTGQNTGISGGRYIAASHFDQTDSQYMIYFEDDMILRNNSLNVCNSGFRTYHENLFDDVISIMELEDLSFLKLCFSEVYGNNHQNWSLGALTEEDRNILRNSDPHGIFSSDFVCVDHTGSFNGLPYAVGGYHYCNWPILFNKYGNKTLFLDNPLNSKYESAWTRLSYLLILKGLIRGGCLLISPIKHYRKQLYNSNDRVENEQGLKIKGAYICVDSN